VWAVDALVTGEVGLGRSRGHGAPDQE